MILRGLLRTVLTASLFLQPAQQPQKATLRGVVRLSRTGDPFPGARVTLFGQNIPASPRDTPPAAATAVTDRDGTFLLPDLDPGNFRLVVGMNGFVRYESNVVLTAGQTKDDIVVRLIQTATVSGHISVLTGKPAAGVTVQIQRRNYNTNGSLSFATVATAQTNDLGDYRAYWVTPGRYYVSVRGTSGSVFMDAAGDFDNAVRRGVNSVSENYPQTFYPGVTDSTQALALELSEGAELTGIDFKLPGQQQLYSIRGRVIDASTGQSPSRAMVMMGGSWSIRWFDSSTGTFEIPSLVPGRYNLQARLGDPNIGASLLPGATPTGEPIASMAVTITDSDIENVTLTIAPPPLITGKVDVEGELPAASPLERLRVTLAPSSSLSGSPASAPVSADASFTILAPVDGEYRVTIATLPPGFYLKEARFNNTNALNPTRMSTAGTLDILISSRTGQVTGRLLNTQGNPAAVSAVTLIPDESRDRPELYKRAITDNAGLFTITGVAPGSYKVFAWERLEANAYYDSQVLAKFEQWGAPVRVTESSSVSTDARLIPAGEAQ